jgi:hypothetical protein
MPWLQPTSEVDGGHRLPSAPPSMGERRSADNTVDGRGYCQEPRGVAMRVGPVVAVAPGVQAAVTATAAYDCLQYRKEEEEGSFMVV